jgi:hypothetical protein
MEVMAMSDKNSKDNENQSYISSHPSIHKKFKNWILNKDKEMMYMKNNNENKKIDVSKVSGGVLSIEEKDGKFNVISSRVLDSFESREKAQEAINNVAERNWHHGFGEPNHHGHHHGFFKPEKHMLLLPEDISKDNGK